MGERAGKRVGGGVEKRWGELGGREAGSEEEVVRRRHCSACCSVLLLLGELLEK